MHVHIPLLLPWSLLILMVRVSVFDVFPSKQPWLWAKPLENPNPASSLLRISS